jgi:hypothetical protein
MSLSSVISDAQDGEFHRYQPRTEAATTVKAAGDAKIQIERDRRKALPFSPSPAVEDIIDRLIWDISAGPRR